MNKTIQKAEKIALRDLRACYHGDGVFASLVNYSDYWARDTFWASFGMLEIGDEERVRKSLRMFLDFQLPNGKIPRKIALNYTKLKYLKLKIERSEPLPIYKAAIRNVYSVDDNLLFVIAFCRYVKKSRDLDFAKKNFNKVLRALDFYRKEKLISSDHLITEIGISNWMDTILKDGYILYTNCLWFEAVRGLEELSKKVGRTRKTRLPTAKRIKSEIQKMFWKDNAVLFEEKNKTSDFFVDYVKFSGEVQPWFDLAGNVLAVIFGIADRKQAKKIVQIIDDTRTFAFRKPAGKIVLHPCVFPRYPLWKIRPVRFITMSPNYQNGISWSWLEALVIAAKVKAGEKDSAEKDLRTFSKVLVKNKNVHETLLLDGLPYDTFIWKSAVPFAWGSGLFLWALSEMKK